MSNEHHTSTYVNFWNSFRSALSNFGYHIGQFGSRQCFKRSRSSRTDPVRVPKFPDWDRYEFHFQKTWIGSVRIEVIYENSRTDPFRVVPDVGPSFYAHCTKKRSIGIKFRLSFTFNYPFSLSNLAEYKWNCQQIENLNNRTRTISIKYVSVQIEGHGW